MTGPSTASPALQRDGSVCVSASGAARGVAVALAMLAGCHAEPPPVSDGRAPPKVVAAPGPDAAPPTPDPPGTYMGRTIAATMSHLGAPWLVRPEREREENTHALIRALRLQPGDTACDLGAGNGYHALRMAAAVGATGRVIASDLQPEMLEALRARATAAGVRNVDTVLATERNPRLPAGACDVVLMVDVYHELSDPAAVLARIRPSLSPRGHIALVEFRAEDPAVPIKPLHKMSKAQILREYEANDYRLTRAFDALPWQHLMFFAPNGRASEDDKSDSGAGTR